MPKMGEILLSINELITVQIETPLIERPKLLATIYTLFGLGLLVLAYFRGTGMFAWVWLGSIAVVLFFFAASFIYLKPRRRSAKIELHLVKTP